jgi:hypothetical protein
VSDIFQEIDEDLRRENFAKLWTRYGRYVIALAVLVVVATGVVGGWREYQLRQRRAEGVRYATALDLARQGKDKEAAAAFGALADEAGGGHAVLARFEAAALKAKTSDIAGALATYDALAADGSIETTYRDLATLLAAQYRFKDSDPKSIIDRLAPLTAAANPWHPSALELTALAQLKASQKPEAVATFKRIADDLAAPQSLRARAAEMAAAIAGREVMPPSGTTVPSAAAPADSTH